MNASVRTTHSTSLLLTISKIVAVLLLIFLPTVAQAQVSSRYSSSSNRYAAPAVYQQEPASYQMTHTSTYTVGTTYNPAQTVYEPFSNESPSNSGDGVGSLGGDISSTGKDGFIKPNDPLRPPVGEPWILLVFATIGAGVIFLKQRKRLEVKD